jgi:hypothetical protein
VAWGLVALALVPGLAAERVPPRDRDAALLDFFRRLTLTHADHERVGALARQLDSSTYKEREKATALLLAEGPRGVPLMRKAMTGATLERRMRLEKCVKALETPAWLDGVAEAARRVGERRPEGACAVLLAFLPYAPEESVDEILDTLCRLAVHHGNVRPELLAALEDPAPERRAAAAVVAACLGDAPQRGLVRALLADPEPVVRYRAAQGLLAARDKAAVPVLVGLLQAELALAERAESLLLAVAGKDAPTLPVKERAKSHAAWSAWWEAHQDRVDLSRAEVGLQLGYGPHLARKAAVDLMDGLLGQADLLDRCLGVPFYLLGQDTFQDRDICLKFFRELAAGNKGRKPPYTHRVIRVVRAAEQDKYCVDKRDRDFVASQPRGATLAVHMVLTDGSMVEQYALVVRLSGGRGRVVGICNLRAGE